jgi:hypothetical protein
LETFQEITTEFLTPTGFCNRNRWRFERKEKGRKEEGKGEEE